MKKLIAIIVAAMVLVPVLGLTAEDDAREVERIISKYGKYSLMSFIYDRSKIFSDEFYI